PRPALRPAAIELPVVDLLGLPERERMQVAFELAGLEARRPFDLAEGPLLRARLFRRADREHLLLVVLHPLISDARPTPVLLAAPTLFMTLLAAFQVLLLRYTDEEDILVGIPFAHRFPAETEPLIGFFLNTLVLRGDLSGKPSFRELLRRTRRAALGAYAHPD